MRHGFAFAGVLLLAMFGGGAFSQVFAQSGTTTTPPEVRGDRGKNTITLPPNVPAKVGRVLAYVDQHGKALPGYEGGRNFLNLERHLPQTDRRGRSIRYREWDVNPLQQGVNRGPERLVTGSDGSAHYTHDHYRSFLKIR